FLLLPTAIVRPLSSLAKFSFVISNIRFPPGKRAPWQDTGMPASHYACQSPLNKIVLILRRACGVIFEWERRGGTTGISGREPGSTSGSRHGVGGLFSALRGFAHKAPLRESFLCKI